ncbi:MAG: hypothetical protein V4649_17190 [Bacteroidota bacterium]
MLHQPRLITYRLWLFIGLLAIVLFAESAIPYLYAARNAGPGHVFLGQVAYTPDQNMYFSFISQAREGQFVFSNKLTAIPHTAVFVNLEWWLIGAIQHITGISENAVYQVWRLLGILLLATGIVMLARIVLPPGRRVLLTTATLLFTGGFGFVFALLSGLHLLGQSVLQPGIIDMRYGLLPFQQIVTNPHFSFPHGLILIAYAFFLLGEQRERTKYYLLSGLMFTIIGLVRPYDIIPPFVIFPLYTLFVHRCSTLRQLVTRSLPLLITIPVLLYNVWLFKVNDVFKYWSQQGLNAGVMPSPLWHYMAYGIIGVLAIARMAQLRKNPLNVNERFLVLWFAVTFLFIQLGRYFPILGWSPQIGVYLAVPLALLGFGIDTRAWLKRGTARYGVITAAVAVIAISNISIVLYFAKNFNDPSKRDIYYARNEEMDAWQWMRLHIPAGKVVLALPATSQRIAKHTNARVIAAHYSVTPKYAENAVLAYTLFSGGVIDEQRFNTGSDISADYLYIGPEEHAASKATISMSPHGFVPLYSNSAVTIYKVLPGVRY